MPGVGSFDFVIKNLKKKKLYGKKFIKEISQKKVLAICVGLQILFKKSDEGKLPGLNILEDIPVKRLDKIGFDYVCVSSGGIQRKTSRIFKPFFRSKFSKQIKKETNLIVGITGQTDNFQKAINFMKKKYFDIVFIGKPFLKNPFFLFHDKYLKSKIFKKIPNQYQRSI